jgi:glucokinase
MILNPSIILLGGEVGSHPFLLHEVQKLLKGSEFALVRVQPGALGPSAVLWGGICITLEPTILGLLQNSTHSS